MWSNSVICQVFHSVGNSFLEVNPYSPYFAHTLLHFYRNEVLPTHTDKFQIGCKGISLAATIGY